MRRTLWIIAGAWLACAIGAWAWYRSNHVPVSVYTGKTSTTDTRPLRIELYDYVHPDKMNDFEVRPGPPLAFAFPRAYYDDGLTLRGGPLATASLEIDTADWQPWALSDQNGRADGFVRGTAAERAAFERRHLVVNIHSNYSGGPRTEYYFLDRENAVALEKPWQGFSLVAYRAPLQPPKPRGPLWVDGVDMHAADYVAYRSNPRPGQVYFFDCPRWHGCNAELIYYGRRVEFQVSNAQMSQIDALGAAIVRLLDRYRVTNPGTRMTTVKFTLSLRP